MKEVSSVSEMKKIAKSFREKNLTVGLVPTMGCLHEGHLSLVKQSIQSCDRTIVSIFVNPTQFGPNEDLDTYPRQLQADSEILEEVGVDVLFHPTSEEMYPENYNTYVEVEGITEHLCGRSRPDLFRGVSTVVLKLFNIVQPHNAFFGEKDWQQLAVIESLVKDLNLDVVIKRVPIVRESDGLAMSSRNRYLSPRERQTALSLSRTLKQAKDAIRQGTKSVKAIESLIHQSLIKEKELVIDYISICDPVNFVKKEKICDTTLIALAVKIGSSRLIDNCIIEEY
ncbi:MAG: pantoate--beta-alanine ligase [Nitrospinae bacterium]|nr:pantoate--beta-alanine ligase [Nitrospinota bacterium]